MCPCRWAPSYARAEKGRGPSDAGLRAMWHRRHGGHNASCESASELGLHHGSDGGTTAAVHTSAAAPGPADTEGHQLGWPSLAARRRAHFDRFIVHCGATTNQGKRASAQQWEGPHCQRPQSEPAATCSAGGARCPGPRRRRLPLLLPDVGEPPAAARLSAGHEAAGGAASAVAGSRLAWQSQCTHPIHPSCS